MLTLEFLRKLARTYLRATDSEATRFERAFNAPVSYPMKHAHFIGMKRSTRSRVCCVPPQHVAVDTLHLLWTQQRMLL